LEGLEVEKDPPEKAQLEAVSVEIVVAVPSETHSEAK
jgi:hypothetical protein